MSKLISFLFVVSALTQTVASQTKAEPVTGRFVAFDKFADWGNPREPQQLLIVEIGQKSKSKASLSEMKLIKVVYLPETNGRRGGAKFLDEETLNYQNHWKMRLESSSDREMSLCDVDNFLRTSEDEVDTNEKGEPTLRFHSTQIDADVALKNLSNMPCMILRSFSK